MRVRVRVSVQLCVTVRVSMESPCSESLEHSAMAVWSSILLCGAKAAVEGASAQTV